MLKGLDFHIGIDLGTCNTLIYQKGKGIVLQEPSAIAVRRDTGEIEAFGEQAEVMVGKTSDQTEVIYPLQEGVIADFHFTSTLLQRFVQKLLGGPMRFFRRPHVMVSVPFGINEVKKRAVHDAVMQMGAKKVTTVEEPLAAALGAGLPVEEPIGSMVVDIGGGTTQAAVISMGGLVVGHTVPKAGISVDLSIVEYMKYSHSLEIGIRTAERVKQKLGSAVKPEMDETMEIKGRDLVTGMPKTIRVQSVEIHKLLDDLVDTVIDTVRVCLEKCPPELVGDIFEHGILLCGGGSLLHGLDQRLQQETNVPVFLAEQPLECIAMGTGKLLYSPNKTFNFLSEHVPVVQTENAAEKI